MFYRIREMFLNAEKGCFNQFKGGDTELKGCHNAGKGGFNQLSCGGCLCLPIMS